VIQIKKAGQKKQRSVSINDVKIGSNLIRGLEQPRNDIPRAKYTRRNKDIGGRMVKYIARKWRKFTEKEVKDWIQPVFLASRQRRPPAAGRYIKSSIGALYTFAEK
jgi:hypothetical protein